MSNRQHPSETITAEVGGWPGVESGPGPRGGELAFTVDGGWGRTLSPRTRPSSRRA